MVRPSSEKSSLASCRGSCLTAVESRLWTSALPRLTAARPASPRPKTSRAPSATRVQYRRFIFRLPLKDAEGSEDARARPCRHVSTRYVGRVEFVSDCLIRSSPLSNLTATLQGSAVGKSNPLTGLDVGLRGRLRRPGAAPSYCSEYRRDGGALRAA